MFKFTAKKAVIVTLLSLATLISIPFNALAAGVVATNMEQLQAAIVTEMTARDTDFTINYTGSSANLGVDITNAATAAKNSDDYLKWSWTSLTMGITGVKNNVNINFKAAYLTTATQEDYVDTTVTQALASIITPGMSEDQKAKAIHTWVLNKLAYDYTLANHSAYDGLAAPNKTVCQGYSLLMYKMLTEAGFSTRIVNSTLKGGLHTWNIVKINGVWYNVDATNNDVYANKFYNVTDSILTQNGFVWDKTSFPSATTTYVEGTTPAAPTTVITLNKPTADLKVDSTTILVATSAQISTVTWKSSNPSIVSVKDGVITGVGSGTATVTATSPDGTATASCIVTVSAAEVVDTVKVTLDKTSASVVVGSITTLKATSTPNSSVNWKSSNPAVATVTDGKVEAKTAGTATITATDVTGTASATCTVTVTAAQVIPVTFPAKITLNKTALDLSKGSYTNIGAAITHPGSTQVYPWEAAVWASSNPAVATVVNGKIVGVSTGTATITATTKDGTATASCEVTVKAAPVAAQKITLNKTTAPVAVGSTTTITVSTSPSSTVTWASSNPAVATITNGTIKGVSTGTATITATAKNGISASCTVTVSASNTLVTLSKTTLSLTAGATLSVTAKITHPGATGTFPFQTVVWTSSNPSVATVSNGAIKALTAGTTTITATAKDGSETASCTVTVSALVVPPSKVVLDKTSTQLSVGATTTIRVAVSPVSTVTWTSSDSSVVTVTNGKITGIKAGTATITATAKDGTSSTCTVSVQAVTTKITMTKTALTVAKGKSIGIGCSLTHPGATGVFPWQGVVWSSNNTSIATVSAGQIKGLATGTAIITATSKDGTASASCTLTVK